MLFQVDENMIDQFIFSFNHFCTSRANSKVGGAAECMRLLKHRAEYELYADVILVSSLFETFFI